MSRPLVYDVATRHSLFQRPETVDVVDVLVALVDVPVVLLVVLPLVARLQLNGGHWVSYASLKSIWCFQPQPPAGQDKNAKTL